MDELVKAFRVFIARDLVFIVSGGTVVGTFLYIFRRVPESSDSWVLFVLLAGIAYFVAYAIQDTLCILRIVPSIPAKRPCGVVRWMYKRIYYKKWKPIRAHVYIEIDEARHKVPLKRQPELERLVTLQQIGTAGGPCILLSGVLFLCKWSHDGSVFDGAVAGVGILLGIVLVCLAWLKAAQRARFLETYARTSALHRHAGSPGTRVE